MKELLGFQVMKKNLDLIGLIDISNIFPNHEK
jgi:hypothetical protein